MKKTLRPYQQEACQSIPKSWERGEIPYLSVMTGLGKSLILAALTNRYVNTGERILQLVPRLELVEQNYKEAFDYMENKSALGMVCGQLGKRQNHKQAVIAMSSSFVNLRATSGAFDKVFVDECFSGDTLISTPNGLKRIDSLSNNDVIYNAIGIGHIKQVSIKNHNIIYTLRLSNGKEIKTTNNHPVFTGNGWKTIEKMDSSDVVFSIQDMRKLRRKVFPHKNRQLCSTKIDFSNKAVLYDIMLKEERKLNVDSWRKRKNDKIINSYRSQANFSRWKWSRINISSDNNEKYIGRRLDNRITNKNICRTQERSLSELLQSGYWKQVFKDSDRAGRRKPQWKKKGIRQEKGFIPNFTRVESISAEKSRCITPMYNLSVSGHPSYFAGGILVHNCHRLQYKKEGKAGTIQKIITSLYRLNPEMKVVGMTGTPYRLDQGELHEESYKTTPFFTHKIYDTSVNPGIKQLIADGFLSYIETLNTNVKVDLTGVKLSGNDFNKDAAGIKFDAIINDAVEDMREQFKENNISTALIFASNLTNARHILSSWGEESSMRIVCGDESICTKKQRKEAIEWIKNGSGNRYIINVDILAEGFDMRHLQCVVLMRATKSHGLMVQMIGRIIRPHDDKECGFLLDYGTNIERLGEIDNIITPKKKVKPGDAPKKPCLAIMDETIEFEGLMYRKGQECGYANILTAKRCKVCSAEFIPSENEDGLYSMRTKAQVLKAKQDASIETFDVHSVYFEEGNILGTPTVKVLFYDEYVSLIHTHHIKIQHSGQWKNEAVTDIMSMLKNKSDYYQFGKFQNGICVKSLLFLLSDEYMDKYFNVPKTIKLLQTGRYKHLVSWSF